METHGNSSSHLSGTVWSWDKSRGSTSGWGKYMRQIFHAWIRNPIFSLCRQTNWQTMTNPSDPAPGGGRFPSFWRPRGLGELMEFCLVMDFDIFWWSILNIPQHSSTQNVVSRCVGGATMISWATSCSKTGIGFHGSMGYENQETPRKHLAAQCRPLASRIRKLEAFFFRLFLQPWANLWRSLELAIASPFVDLCPSHKMPQVWGTNKPILIRSVQISVVFLKHHHHHLIPCPSPEHLSQLLGRQPEPVRGQHPPSDSKIFKTSPVDTWSQILDHQFHQMAETGMKNWPVR